MVGRVFQAILGAVFIAGVTVLGLPVIRYDCFSILNWSESPPGLGLWNRNMSPTVLPLGGFRMTVSMHVLPGRHRKYPMTPKQPSCKATLKKVPAVRILHKGRGTVLVAVVLRPKEEGLFRRDRTPFLRLGVLGFYEFFFWNWCSFGMIMIVSLGVVARDRRQN